MSAEQLSFQAEVSRLLDIVAGALYSEREVFLREVISNASDACDRLRYEAIAKPELAAGDGDYKISIEIDTAARTLEVSDNGCGMNRDELIKNLGTIAHSGTAQLLREAGKNKDTVNLIGQFGVGFYSVFMVADRVEVLSRKAGEEQGWLWKSDGKGAFTIEEALKEDRGTRITLFIKDDASEFLLEERIKQVVKKYSDHISIPIILGADKVLNSASALWKRPKSEVTQEQYDEFYRSVSHGLDTPLQTIHWQAEGAISYSCLLFVPTIKPFDLYDPKRLHALKLYVRRVFITEGVEGLIPPWLRFLRGVVDSEDLPLNISREMLQHNPLVAKIGTGIVKKVLSELEKKAKSDTEGYKLFWEQFGPVIKEGLYDAHQHRGDIFKICRFYSSKSGEELTSLDDYVARMAQGQKEIFYITGEKLETLRKSPQLEGFRARDVEVLFLTDTIDDFWIPVVQDYQGKLFKSITRGKVDLAGVNEGENKKEEKNKKEPAAQDTQVLIEGLRAALGDRIKDVRASDRLTQSPVCLVADESDVDMHMERLLRKHQGYERSAQRILEINAAHPLIARMSALAANDSRKEELGDAALLLLDQALIIEGEALPDPAGFAARMARAMEKGFA